jgi:ABC-type lipoprotein export system ATPase subunit
LVGHHTSKESDAAIALDGLRFAYARPSGRGAPSEDASGHFSLQLTNLEILRGERVAVIGPSACGKTTLLGLIAGILVPDRGQVTVMGADLAALRDTDRRRFRITRMGLVFQSLALVEYLNVLDNILHSYRITNALSLDPDVRTRASELASKLGLEGKLEHPIASLSQGERQRVAIARALLPRPDVLLADEATGNLDPANKGRIIDLLFSQLERDRSTLVAVTHDHDLLDRFDRVLDYREICRA